MVTPHLQELGKGSQQLQHQPEVTAHLSSILTAPEGGNMILRTVGVGGKHTH